MYFNWNAIYRPVFGELGFTNSQQIKALVNEVRIHSSPVNESVKAVEIDPWITQMEDFYRDSIVDLQSILGNYIRNRIKFQEPVSSDSSLAFSQLLEMSASPSGTWSDVVNLLRAMHETGL